MHKDLDCAFDSLTIAQQFMCSEKPKGRTMGGFYIQSNLATLRIAKSREMVLFEIKIDTLGKSRQGVLFGIKIDSLGDNFDALLYLVENVLYA